MTDAWDRFVHLVNWLADLIGPGPAVLLIALTAGALCWAIGAMLILLDPFERLRIWMHR